MEEYNPSKSTMGVATTPEIQEPETVKPVVRENRRFNLFDIEEQQKIDTARETAIHFVASLMDKKDVESLFMGQDFIATQTRKTTRDYWKFRNRLAEFVRWDTYSLRSPRIGS